LLPNLLSGMGQNLIPNPYSTIYNRLLHLILMVIVIQRKRRRRNSFALLPIMLL